MLRDVVAAVTRASAALDRGVVRVMERRMAGGLDRQRASIPDDAHARLIGLAARYGDGTLGLPSRFFPAPPVPLVRARPDGVAHGARVEQLTWASGYRPFLPEYQDEHHRWVENHTAHARLYVGGDGERDVSRLGEGSRRGRDPAPSAGVSAGCASPRCFVTPAGERAGDSPLKRDRPAMVLLHGWGGGAWWLEERAFAIGYWLARGFDVAIFQLPFHGERAPGAVGRGPRSGALFPSANVVRTNEAFGQAIWDLRGLATHLRARGAPAVGAMGMSLGGYTTALWATIDPALAFAIAMIPAVSMADLMWRHGEDSPARRRAAAAGVSGELLAEVFAVHAPTTRPVLVPRDRLMIVAGEGDRITPPDQAERLRAHWGDCAIHWFPGGHLAQIGRGDAFRAIRAQLARAGLGTPSRRPGASGSRSR